MKILILSDRFYPEVSAASTRLHAHARRWAGWGHDVTVVTCAPNFPRGKLFPGYENRWTSEEEIDGFKVVRVWSFMAPNTGVFKRSIDYASFMVSAILHAGAYGRPDVVVASSPPITVAFAGWVIGKILHRPWVFEVRDLWPASIRAVGFSKNRLLSLLERLELHLYRDAAATIVLTEPFRRDLEMRGVDLSRVTVVTNGVETRDWRPRPDARAASRSALGLSLDAFVVGFVGTMGLAQGAEVFVRTAKRMSSHEGIRFICVGEGADRPKLQAAAIEAGLTNISFHDFVPFAEMPGLLSALDVGAVLLRNDAVFDTVIPSKLLELMAAGVPIAAAAGEETRRLVELARAGACVSPEDDAGLEQVILEMWRNPALRNARGSAGRAFAASEFDRETLARRALDVVELAAGSDA